MMILSEPMRAFAEKLPMGWKVSPFGALLSESLRNGIYKGKEFHGSGTKIVNMGELFEHEYISSQDMRRIELTPQEKERSTLRDGDLLFARRSLVLEGAGKCSLVMSLAEEVTFESSIIRDRPAQEMVAPRFLYYLFASPLGRAIMASIATRTAVSGIRGSDLAQVALPLPPLPIQRRIAGILSAYDDLIENSQRRIKILEEMARRLYREWFVHFRFPGHEGCQFVDSSLGEIPEGWEIRTLAKLCSRMESGGTPKRGNSEYWEGGEIDWYKTGELWDGFLFGSQEKITALGQRQSTARLFDPGTILMAIYGSPTVGRMGILTDNASCNQAALGLVANADLISQTYLFFVLFSLREHFNSLAQGAAQQNISKEKVASAMAVVPPRDILASFDSIADPIFSQLRTLQRQIQNLRRTRDLLLPRLLSGQIDVEALPEPVLQEGS